MDSEIPATAGTTETRTTAPIDTTLPTTDLPSIAAESTGDAPLSKSAQKRAARNERLASVKLERRAREKEAKKEKKRARAEKLASGDIDEEEEEQLRAAKKAKMAYGGPRKPFGAKVVFDLGFDDMMHEKEVSSLCSQLAYAYSANRRSATPIKSMIFTSLDKRTFTRLESMSDAGYKRWHGTEWWAEGYDRLWAPEVEEMAEEMKAETPKDLPDAPMEEEPMTETTGALGDDSATVHTVDPSTRRGRRAARPKASGSKAPQESVVYLTADAEEELNELKEGETYIIGGICDHNRYKNLCLDKAKESNVRAARLPIGTYLASMPTRKVLTVNQVFEILLRWVETRDWEQAMMAVMPKRKFIVKGGGGGPQQDVEDDVEEGDVDAETGNILVFREEDLVNDTNAGISTHLAIPPTVEL